MCLHRTSECNRQSYFELLLVVEFALFGSRKLCGDVDGEYSLCSRQRLKLDAWSVTLKLLALGRAVLWLLRLPVFVPIGSPSLRVS